MLATQESVLIKKTKSSRTAYSPSTPSPSLRQRSSDIKVLHLRFPPTEPLLQVFLLSPWPRIVADNFSFLLFG
ncbi:hypothetical protein AB3S75_037813 [Citrus x aurantiifolia]